MKKVKSLTMWFIANGMIWFAMYLTFIKGNQNTGNLIMFIQWFSFIMSSLVIMMYCVDKEFKENVKRKQSKTPISLHNLNDVSMFLVFAYYGWFCTAIITAIAWEIQIELFFKNRD
jgi:hypothetical protein